MTDIAQIGFAVDTSDLDKAVQKLNALGPAAAGVGTASTKMAAAIEGANASVVAANTAVARSEAQKAQAVMQGMQANKNSTPAELASAKAIQMTAQANLQAAMAEEKRVIAINKVAAAVRKATSVTQAANAQIAPVVAGTGPALVVNNGKAPVARDQAPNRFNTANIAAQFQDIGVTAAMGMNPLQIALQQGTQLSAIMNSMQNPVAGLAQAFKQVFNAISLGTIAIISLVAALIEMVNWIKVAQALLYGLADVIQTTLPYVAGLAAALALIYSRQILAGIASLSVSLLGLAATALMVGTRIAAAWFIGLGPIGWAIGLIAAITAAFELFGVNAVGFVKKAANDIIGAFVGAFMAVKATWMTLPAVMGDLVIQAANAILDQLNGLVNGFVTMVNSLIDKLPDDLKPKGGKIVWTADVHIDNPYANQAADAGKKAADAFSDAFKRDYVGSAISGTKNLANAAAKGIRNYADHLGDDDGKKQRGKTDEEKYQDIVNGADRKIASMQAEQDSIGLSEFATAKLKYETDLLNEAQEKNITLTDEGKAELEGRATDMATLAAKTKDMKDAFDFAHDAVKGFFEDMKNGLQQGKSLWESFGTAVTNVLNKILDKMLDSGVDMLFGGSANGPGAGGLGVFGSLFGSLLGSGTQAPAAGAAGPTMQGTGILGALGFAKGGTFTDGMVNRPTPFTFGSGGQLGVMGEAGPEAIVPLHRGSDGSLGIKSSSAGSGGGVIVNVINNANASVSTSKRQGSQGMEIDVMIDQMVAQKVSDQSSETNRSLQARDSRQLIQR